MQRYSKVFFSSARADKFSKELEVNGAIDIEVWAEKDAFNQTQYIVKWNLL